MLIGAQTYTLRNYMKNEKEIARSLEKVAEMGYKTVQISGLGPIEPKTLKGICDGLGLKIVLTHVPEDRILNDTDKLIEEHNILDCKYIGLGAMSDRFRGEEPEWLDYFIEIFKVPAQKIAAAGKLFMYHNHNFEFQKVNGVRIFDRLIDGFTKEEMGFTLDTYWIQAGGADICDWIERLRGRIPCVHFKDMDVKGFTPVMAPVGEGNIPFKKIVKQLESYGDVEYALVEQDVCAESPFVCLKKSYDFLSSLGCK